MKRPLITFIQKHEVFISLVTAFVSSKNQPRPKRRQNGASSKYTSNRKWRRTQHKSISMGPHVPSHLPQWPPRPSSVENATSAWLGSSIKSRIHDHEAEAGIRPPRDDTTAVVETTCPAGLRELHEVHHADSGSVLSSPIFQGRLCEEELDADDRDVLASREPCSTAAAAIAAKATAAAAQAATTRSSVQELERRRECSVGAGTTGRVIAGAVRAASKKITFDCVDCSSSNSNSLAEVDPCLLYTSPSPRD